MYRRQDINSTHRIFILVVLVLKFLTSVGDAQILIKNATSSSHPSPGVASADYGRQVLVPRPDSNQYGYKLMQHGLRQFNNRSIITWPYKPDLSQDQETKQEIVETTTQQTSQDEETKEDFVETTTQQTLSASTTSEQTRTTGGGLLLHLTLPPAPPPGSIRGPPPQDLLIETLRTQLQSTSPGVKVDWTRETYNQCPAEQDSRFRTPDGKPLNWPATKIGEKALSVEACLDSRMQPVQRPCVQDLTFGAQWGEPDGKCDEASSSAATAALLNVTGQQVTPQNVGLVTRMLAEALNLADTPRAGDVLLVADALARVSDAAHGLSAASVPHLTTLLDGVLRSSDASQEDNNVEVDAMATNSILTSLDTILSRLKLDDTQNGMASSHTERAALLVADIARSGVRGVMALPLGPESSAFAGVQPLAAGVDNSQCDVAARILGDLNDGRASFVFIGTNRTFPRQNTQQVFLNSRVVGVTVTGSGGVEGVELELRSLEEPGPGQERQCAYWDLEAGAWSTEGCELVRHDAVTGRDTCRCTHLTHFGEILGVRGESKVLDIISLVGCSLSLLGLLGIGLTAAFFRQWRSRLGNKILLNLSGAIGLTMIAFLGIALGGASGGTGDPGCIILGVMMHYSVLAAFCWMLVSAALQLLRFVVVISARPPHFLLKGVLFGWGAPLVPVCGLFIAGPISSYAALDRGDGTAPFCYPRGLGLVLAVIVPIAMAVIANLVAFCVIVYRVSCGRNKKLHGKVTGISERRMAIRQLRMSILLFFLLGLSWVFALMALALPTVDELRIIFSYLFCATATLQGLALFLFFIVWERKARALWISTLPESVTRATSETTSGFSRSTTGTISGAPVLRSLDESAPLRQRSADVELRVPIRGNNNNGYHSTIQNNAPTRL